MIVRLITSQTSPQEIFMWQANAQAMEDWANKKELFVRDFNRAEYLVELGKQYLYEKTNQKS